MYAAHVLVDDLIGKPSWNNKHCRNWHLSYGPLVAMPVMCQAFKDENKYNQLWHMGLWHVVGLRCSCRPQGRLYLVPMNFPMNMCCTFPIPTQTQVNVSREKVSTSVLVPASFLDTLGRRSLLLIIAYNNFSASFYLYCWSDWSQEVHLSSAHCGAPNCEVLNCHHMHVTILKSLPKWEITNKQQLGDSSVVVVVVVGFC